jgi:hypothetical protein
MDMKNARGKILPLALFLGGTTFVPRLNPLPHRTIFGECGFGSNIKPLLAAFRAGLCHRLLLHGKDFFVHRVRETNGLDVGSDAATEKQ